MIVFYYYTNLELNSVKLHVNIDIASAMVGPPRTERMEAVNLIPVCSAVGYT